MPKPDLDALEAVAVRAVYDTYDVRESDVQERFWIQKGIEGMRLAVAKAWEDEKYVHLGPDFDREDKVFRYDDGPLCPRCGEGLYDHKTLGGTEVWTCGHAIGK